MKTRFIFSILSLICASSYTLANTQTTNRVMHIEVAKPTFVLPQFSEFYNEREVTIAPEEAERAEQLRALLEINDTQKVLSELEKFYDIELSVAMLSLKAQVYFAIKEYKKAEKTYLACLKRSPQLVRAHSDLGQLYLLTDQPKKAQQAFSKAVAYGANDAIVFGQLGYLNLTLNGPFSAIYAYQRALTIEPSQKQWQQGLLTALTQAKLFDSALALTNDLLNQDKQDARLWLSKAIIEMELENTSAALAALELAILYGDKSANNYQIAAQLHFQLQSYDRAVSLINQQVADNSLSFDTVNLYLNWLLQANLSEQAAHLLANTLDKADSFDERQKSQLLFHQARLESDRDQIKTAIATLELSLTHNPNNGDSLLLVSQLHKQQHQYVKAEIALVRAEALELYKKDAMLNRAQLYIDQRDYSSALTVLTSVKQTFDDTEFLTEQIKIIENILTTQKG